MGLFKRKKLKSLAPPFTYEPEELLHNYFDFLGIAVVKENEKYHFISKERVPEDFKKYSGMSTAGVYKGEITYNIPSESFSSVSEMIQVLSSILEETLHKPLLQIYVTILLNHGRNIVVLRPFQATFGNLMIEIHI